MTDFVVHRLKIGNWRPVAVKAIAADVKLSSSKIAVGREDGEIEVSE